MTSHAGPASQARLPLLPALTEMRAQVYVAELAQPLLACMWQLCSPSTVVLLAYYERSAKAHAQFWELLPNFFTADRIDEATTGRGEHASSVGLFRLHQISREEDYSP